MDGKRKFSKFDLLMIVILAAFGGILIWKSVPGGCLFGSETDWYCQHVTLADYMRKHFYATGELLPDFSGLGGGSNFYSLSYYGLLRPDVLLSYFLPKVSVAAVIQGYAIFEIFLGMILIYVWLKRRGLKTVSCAAGGFLYLCAGCLFQAHRQIMFMNYLPFVILAFLTIDSLVESRRETPLWLPHMGLVLSLLMIILHSYYFFPACFAACGVYLWFRISQTPLNIRSIYSNGYGSETCAEPSATGIHEGHCISGICGKQSASGICTKSSASEIYAEHYAGKASHKYIQKLVNLKKQYSCRTYAEKQYRRRLWLHFLVSTAVAVGLSMAMILPTGLAILETRKDAGASTSLLKILTVNPTMDSILYSTYGCGLTLFSLYALLLGINRKKTKKLSILLLFFLGWDAVYWLLNGTLYVRPKSLIPFLPLLVYLAALAFEELAAQKISHNIRLAVFCLFPVTVQLIYKKSETQAVQRLIIADALLLLLMVCGDRLFAKAEFGIFFQNIRHKLHAAASRIAVPRISRFIRQENGSAQNSFGQNSFGKNNSRKNSSRQRRIPAPRKIFTVCCLALLVFVLPTQMYLGQAKTENFVPAGDASRETFSETELASLCEDGNARMDVLDSPMTNSNYMADGLQNRSSVYSSISNGLYSTLYYDILKMPISNRNRVAMTAGVNPFQEYLMGVKYIQTTAQKLPAGYTVKAEKNGRVLAENDNVLPLAYGSTALLSESEYDKLSYPQNLDTIANRTIVPDEANKKGTSASAKNTSDLTASDINIAQNSSGLTESADNADSTDSTDNTIPVSYTAYKSQMQSYTLPKDFLLRDSADKTTVTRNLPETLSKDTVLLLSFDLDYHGSDDIFITVNGIKNCLSGSSAPYPNRNSTFTYMLSGENGLDSLKITFSKGDYVISNIQAYTLPLSALNHPGVMEFHSDGTGQKSSLLSGTTLLSGSIEMKSNGYFVTSYAWTKGYTATVDGKEVTPVKVNKAFVGFPLTKGAHEITLKFHAPGKLAGAAASLFSILFTFCSGLLYALWTVRHYVPRPCQEADAGNYHPHPNRESAAAGHQNRVLGRISVIPFPDSIAGKTQPLVKTEGRSVTDPDLQVDGRHPAFRGKAD